MSSASTAIRNVAIIAHVDHGKTSLVDAMLQETGAIRREMQAGDDLVMDSNPLERERGITIVSKNCSVEHDGPDGPVRINLIDTPGHADFGGEVERVLRMADAVLLIVDAFEGPRPQTRFVLSKALALGLRPFVVVNKCDRPDARPAGVVDEVFDLLGALDAPDEALDFEVLYTSAREGWSNETPERPDDGGTMRPLLDTIATRLPGPTDDADAPFQMLVTTVDDSEYVGRIAIGRVHAGVVRSGQAVARCTRDGTVVSARVLKVHRFAGLGREAVDEVRAGDLCALEGLGDFDIGDTVADPAHPVPLPRVHVDEPTMHMVFKVNDAPSAGREGKFVTARQIENRLQRELRSNVALRVEPGEGPDEFKVSGRGLLHLGILIETMRREGFELAIGRPEVVRKEIDGVLCEPWERLTVDVASDAMGPVLELIGARSAEIRDVDPRGDRVRIEADIPSRGLIGLRPRLLGATAGEAVLEHAFDRFAPARGGERRRVNGVLVATEPGEAKSYALQQLSERAVMFVEPGDPVYAGQVVGENSRTNDLPANVVKNKAFSNVRESTKDATVVLKASRTFSLEEALEYVENDELVEVTPTAVRLRKRLLSEADRKRVERRRRQALDGVAGAARG